MAKKAATKKTATKKVAVEKEAPVKVESPPKTLLELKSKFLADKAAHPHKAQELLAQYRKDKAGL
jgi:hypothetical protein